LAFPTRQTVLSCIVLILKQELYQKFCYSFVECGILYDNVWQHRHYGHKVAREVLKISSKLFNVSHICYEYAGQRIWNLIQLSEKLSIYCAK
ncbi:MAG: hypothetical protein LBS73_06130, partial [Campylobacteraceae bacterium]|nr:hypothetical protein [Campylobacteraceae bacterium]